jgi:hypothetical protein
MNNTVIRLRYTQFFIVCLLGISIYTMTQSLSGGISQFENNFWGRKSLVTSFTRLRLKLGDRVFPQALVCKQGWLEYTGESNLDGYQNAGETPPEALKNTRQKLQELYGELRKRNITLLLVISPNKATIYPDKLPDEIQKLHPQSKLDVFTAYIQQHGPPVLIDLRPALQQGRKKQDIYYKTDTHWNQYGAFISYTEIMKEVSQPYPQLAPKRIEDFNITTGHSSAHDISRIMGATDLREPTITFSLKKKEISTAPKTNLPTLLMYMDSFGSTMTNFISPHFSKTTFIRISSISSSSSKNQRVLFLKTLDTLKPDVVIVELVERSFNSQVLDSFLKQVLSR